MADIFISYSRQDSEHADVLAELLTSAGLSVWIDKRGIEAASSWSQEIVVALDECSAFIVMLSPASVASPNVVKEVSLASEKQKKILPLDLEPVELPTTMQYALAGIQRAPMTNIDAIIRALGKLGLHATSAPSYQIVRDESRARTPDLRDPAQHVGRASLPDSPDTRKSLMILPFEDLSPTADNAWFADGIVSEMISALSNVKALRVTDAATTKEYKSFKGQLVTYAREMNIRYFVQGDVRKFGDNIKITSRLLDIETGEHLWQDSMKGTMNDIFDIQEKVAEKVVEGLKIHLASDEKKKLAERGTENAEAYEYTMRGNEFFSLHTREGILQAISLYNLALTLDPLFVRAVFEKAISLFVLFKNYERDPTLLRESELLLQRVDELDSGNWIVHGMLSTIYLLQGRAEEAGREHQAHIDTDDGSASSKDQLGYYYFCIKQYSRSFEYYDAATKLEPTLSALWNVIFNAHLSGNREGFESWFNQAISTFQKRQRLHPEDLFVRYYLAATYFWSSASLRAESLREIDQLESLSDLDCFIQYQVATLLADMREDGRAIEFLRKAIAKGLTDVDRVRAIDSSFAPLFGMPEFEAVMQEAEALGVMSDG